MNDFIDYIISPYQTYSALNIILETVATLFGIISVYYTYKRNILVYPTTIISTFIFIYLFFNWGLYGETIINVYYTSMAVYGWLLWQKNLEEDHKHVEVSWASKKEYFYGAILFILSFLFILTIYYFRPVIQNGFDFGFITQCKLHYTKIDFIDASTTALFLIGMWLMARRKIDNWFFWIIGDLIMIPLMMYKGAVITSFQYLVLLGISILGLIEWKKKILQK
ncbi:nicotinamide mononucleotide transporter [Empedobacter brevis]|uniref:Nicotinamide riboside transporter PnuC n=2 Tax=Empedobacter brevis TaxID=247 RepID=A0A511NK11_9FLAO|nr:nicotinamide riboside transporter PnuC [Empedobacter brevis]MDM1072967.1 nicotinamide mononucleotide transporter [Empedobacter brevis]QHC83481.1 nicotinamide mononucleotide transporter [Empedobacter brevis]GEM53114.1 nicotinamide mononucleotide transporter [Empedobacter brevis NBRC 14943 = ATCC 43319]